MCPNGSMARPEAQASSGALDKCTYLHAEGKIARVELYPGGLRVRVLGLSQVGGGIRGKVFGKSRQARRRQMITMMQLRPVGAVYFVTLTLSDELLRRGYTSQQVAVWLKLKLRALQMRFVRQWPQGWALWGEEWQSRKSGEFLGVLMPHVHLIVGGVGVVGLDRDGYLLADDLEKTAAALQLQHWFKENWADVCGLDDQHRRRGADVQELDSRRKVFAYIAKYTGKVLDQPVDAGTGELIHTGRMWGYWNKAAMPLFEAYEWELTRSEFVAFRRLAKRWLKARGGRSSRRYARWVARTFGGMVLFGFGLDALGGVPDGLRGGHRSDGRGFALFLRVLDLESG